jgi:hypothetical protein
MNRTSTEHETDNRLTPEQEKQFAALVLAVERIDEFWNKLPYAGDPTRAKQLDTILRMSRGVTWGSTPCLYHKHLGEKYVPNMLY